MGFAIGAALTPLIGDTWLIVMATAFVLGGGAYVWARYGRWSNENLEKGWRGERRVGEEIEHAITARGCAVAHGVKDVAAIGDIDHLVATPSRLWVVETKYRWLPKEAFTEALRRLERNMDAVAMKFPQTPIQGCLVLAYEKEKEVKRRRYNNGRIVVHKPETLLEALQDEAQRKLSLDPAVAKRIWELAVTGESDEKSRW